MAELVAVEEALAQVLERVRPRAGEPVPLAEAAGRFLAADAAAAVDLPRFPSSAMDGFALRAADTPGTLPVVARIAAGRPAPRALADGEAMAIATGGVVPEGADAVVPIELVSERDGAVVVGDPVRPAANIRPLGGDVRAGDRVLPAGLALSPSRLAALAAAGVSHPVCAVRPRVAIVATGTELRPPGEPLGEGEIYESNGLMLAALFRSLGALVEAVETVSDDPAAHRSALARGLEADVLVTSGGVSVGPHDLVREILAELGAEEVFWRVAMRPGKPISFSVRGETLVFGLPGNPVSSLVGALLFVAPALRALQGAGDPLAPWAWGTLGAPARRHPQRDDFQRARIEESEAGVVLVPIEGQESHMIVRAAAADALVHVPRGDEPLPAGAAARYLPLGAV
ncbi:MAG: molybdopterin molybdotransferase MoeA [Gaiella sp.]|nr:molybdopterin molybdotransferase MoeA [Gaiella sp.]